MLPVKSPLISQSSLWPMAVEPKSSGLAHTLNQSPVESQSGAIESRALSCPGPQLMWGMNSTGTPMERTSKLHKWEGTAVSEVLTTIGALICMGVHKEKTIRSYWKPPKPGDQRPAHSFIKFISYNKSGLSTNK
jgi:hypothetical protein